MAANLTHHRNPGERGRQLVAQPRPASPHALDQLLAAQHVEDLQPYGAGHRSAVPRVTEREPSRALGERLVHVVRAYDGADRGVARAKALRGGDDVRNERQLLGGKPLAAAADSGDDLVVADQESMAGAPLREALPETRRRRVRR